MSDMNADDERVIDLALRRFDREARAKASPDGQAGTDQASAADREADLKKAPADIAAAMAEMNRRYFVARMGSRAVVVREEHDDCLQRRRLLFLQARDVRLLHGHQHCVVGIGKNGQEIKQDLGSLWLKHPDRRTYDRIMLLPNQTAPPEVYNLWSGWGVEPKAGEWSIIHVYLLDVVCAGDRVYYVYLLDWCAHAVQHPGQPAEVAVVLRGLKGTGKGTLGRLLIRIFRHHALHIAQPRHLVGNFNAHLADCLFLFVDEAFWGGDKQADGILKALITEPTLMIEAKGVDAFMMLNRLKIVLASNADWVVPATADERR
jgi:hypothetical protein